MSNWSVIGAAWDSESEEMVTFIREKTGCEPKFFALYATMRAFIRHAGINESRPVAYRNGHYMGDIENLKRILE